MDIATKKIINEVGDSFSKINTEDRRIAEIRFMWIPGDRPVKVPARIPARNVRIISSSILV